MSDSSSARGIWSVLIGLVFLTSVATVGAREHNWWPFRHEAKATTVTATSDIPGRAGNLQSADKAIGMRVENLQGEKLGSIKDLVVTQERSKVTYVLLSSGTKLYPVPWEVFGSGQKYYTLDITRDNLNGAPTIGSSEIDRLKNPDMIRQVNDFYSKMMPAREDTEKHFSWMKSKSERILGPSEKDILFKCSTVLGTNIYNPEGKKIASISDVVFDVRSGKLDYSLARFGGIPGIRTKTAAVPFSALTLNIPERRASINADVATLNSAVLAKGDINLLNEPMFASRIDKTFGGEGHIYGYVPPVKEGSTAAWLEGSEYNKMFNANNITTVEGTIKSIDTFTPERGSLEGLKLKIETPSGEKLTIHAGPQAYYMSQNVRFNEGDKVTITGSKVKTGLTSYIMASEIKRGSDTLKFRDESGKPEWKPEVLERPVNPPVEK